LLLKTIETYKTENSQLNMKIEDLKDALDFEKKRSDHAELRN